MKILHLTSHLNVGGITRYILSLATRLIKQGHQVVVASDGGSMEAEVAAMKLTHWYFPFRTSAEFSLRVIFGMRKLIARLREEPVDIIHAHTRVGQVVAHYVSHCTQIPYVTTWHGIYRPRLGRRLWPCTGDAAIAISEPVYENLRRDFHVPEGRIRRIYNGIDIDHYSTIPDASTIREYRARWQIKVNQPVIGGIARLAAGEVKGFDLLLAVAYLLKPIVPGLQVLVVGDGPRRPFLQDVAKRLGVRDKVYFVGSVQDIRIPLALMDVFVFCSRWPEAFGLTLIEAMAAGKPVVAMGIGAVPEIIQHDVNGWLVSPGNISLMVDGISRLLTNPQISERLGRQAQLRVRKMFGLDRMAAEVEKVYEEVIKSSDSH